MTSLFILHVQTMCIYKSLNLNAQGHLSKVKVTAHT